MSLETCYNDDERSIAKIFNPTSPGGTDSAPWDTFRNNAVTPKDIKIKFFRFRGILKTVTILIFLGCCHGNLLL